MLTFQSTPGRLSLPPMPKRHLRLIDRIADLANLRLAYAKTARGKRMSRGYLTFKEYAEANLVRLREILLDGAYQQGPFRQFTVREPKPRLISALDFQDRLVQHALCNQITPFMEATLLPYTFACRPGLGTHAAARHIQALLRRTGAAYFLKTDYAKFFPSLPRAVAHELYARKIGCRATRDLLAAMIPTTGQGIPIGSLTSQLTANLVGGLTDRFIHFELGHRHWARYMDDIVILGSDLGALRADYQRLADFSATRLELGISRWQASPVTRGINFVGYRLWASHKLLRAASVTRAKRTISRHLAANDQAALAKFLPAWLGHARWANAYHLLRWLEDRHAITF